MRIYDQWFRKERSFNLLIKSILLNKRTLQRGYFKEDGLKELIRLQESGRNYFSLIDKLVTFEEWSRLFIDEEVIKNKSIIN